MSEKKASNSKFPGSWEWIGIVCERNNVAVARVSGSTLGVKVLGVWCSEIKSVDVTPEQVLQECKNLIGARLSKKVSSSLVLEEKSYEVISLDEPMVKDLDDTQKQEALRWAIAPLVEFPVDRASIAVLIPTGPGRRQVVTVVSSESVVAPWVVGSLDAKIKLKAIDVRETSQRNLAHLFEDDNKAMGLLVISGSRALLTISASGELLMTRRIDVASLQEISTSSSLLDRIGLEVQRTLDNFERQSGRAGGTHVLVAPGDRSELLTNHLREALGLSIQIMTPERIMGALDVSSGMAVSPVEWSHLELLAIGAACRGVEV